MTQSVQALKKEARALLKDRLKKLTDTHRNLCSLQIFRQVEESSVYRDSRSIFCYLAMPQEVQTMEFIDRSLMEGKRIFVPKITGRKSFDMQAIEVSSMEDIEKFPKNNWGIPEPTKDPDDEACKHRAFDAIDLVIVPGMGFDSSCRRIGHGKGYYDSFFSECEAYCEKKSKKRPTYLGVAYEEQLLDEIPVSTHDKMLDMLVTPSKIFSIKKQDAQEKDAMPNSESKDDYSGFQSRVQWSDSFSRASKVGKESEKYTSDFNPGGDASDIGSFRQPDGLASFVAARSKEGPSHKN